LKNARFILSVQEYTTYRKILRDTIPTGIDAFLETKQCLTLLRILNILSTGSKKTSSPRVYSLNEKR